MRNNFSLIVNSSPEESEMLKEVVGFDFLKPLVICCMLISTGAAMANLWLIFGLYHSSLVQGNVKLLLVNVSIAAVILCIGEFVHKWLILSRAYMSSNWHEIPGNQCLLESLPKTISNYTLALLMLFVAWERAIATKKFKSYEHQPKFLSWLCVGFAWLAPCIGSTVAAVKYQPNPQSPFCIAGFTYSSILVISYLSFDLVLGFLTLVGYMVVTRINKTKLTFFIYNRAQLRLSARYQLRNNIEITSLLTPTVIFRVISYIFSDASFIYISLSSKSRLKTDSIFLVLACNLIKVLYCLFHPIFLFLRSRKLRSSAKLCNGTVYNSRVSPSIVSGSKSRGRREGNDYGYLFGRRNMTIYTICDEQSADLFNARSEPVIEDVGLKLSNL